MFGRFVGLPPLEIGRVRSSSSSFWDEESERLQLEVKTGRRLFSAT